MPHFACVCSGPVIGYVRLVPGPARPCVSCSAVPYPVQAPGCRPAVAASLQPVGEKRQPDLFHLQRCVVVRALGFQRLHHAFQESAFRRSLVGWKGFVVVGAPSSSEVCEHQQPLGCWPSDVWADFVSACLEAGQPHVDPSVFERQPDGKCSGPVEQPPGRWPADAGDGIGELRRDREPGWVHQLLQFLPPLLVVRSIGVPMWCVSSEFSPARRRASVDSASFWGQAATVGRLQSHRPCPLIAQYLGLASRNARVVQTNHDRSPTSNVNDSSSLAVISRRLKRFRLTNPAPVSRFQRFAMTLTSSLTK